MKRSTTLFFASLLSIPVSFALAGCTVHETRVENRPPPPPPAAAQPAPPPPVQNAAAHPSYLHALSDLRNARGNLERKGGDNQTKWDERVAIEATDRAINDIKQASIDDGKNLEDHPAVDAKEPRSGRLHKALDALRAARKDVEQEEDNNYAQGLKARSIRNIDDAIKRTEEGIAAVDRGA
jgi:hypothetical protein